MTKDETEAYEQQAADVKLELGIWRVNADIFELMDENLIPSTKARESKMHYYKMKGDYDRYLAESAKRGMKSKSAEQVRRGRLRRLR